MFSFSRFTWAENRKSESDQDKANYNVDDHPDNGKNGDGVEESMPGFDDGDVDDLEEEVAESEEELMVYKVA